MRTSSPALSNNSTDTTSIAGNSASTTTTAAMMNISGSTNTSKNLRGLNKPKCIKCGNVARSRCPYQACKSCCAKAQNPCHIHVLKGNSSFLDKAQSSGSPLFDQHSTEASPSGNSHRVASLRQLSNNFAQFNNLQTPVRSRKTLTRKDAALINEWRFMKLKEYKDRNIEAENESFDRYMQNITLLEEVFAVNSTLEEPTKQHSTVSKPNPNSMEEKRETMISEMKLKLRSDPIRAENLRKRVQFIVDQGLRKLKRFETHGGSHDQNEEDELVKRPKKAKYSRLERASALRDLNDKLSKARTEEDLKSCREMKAQLFSQCKGTNEESEEIETSKQQDDKNDMKSKPKSDYSPSKWFSTFTIDQEALNRLDAQFCSLEEIEEL